jgi:hypothetical protein
MVFERTINVTVPLHDVLDRGTQKYYQEFGIEFGGVY